MLLLLPRPFAAILSRRYGGSLPITGGTSRGLSFAALLMAVAAASTALSAYLLKPVLDHIVEANGLAALELLSLSIAGLFLVRGLATYCYLVLLARTGNHIVANVQTKLFDHLLMQDMAFFQDRHSGEFMSRIAVAAASIRDTLQLLIVSAGRDILTLGDLIRDVRSRQPNS